MRTGSGGALCIISGGQSGADRAALDVARALGLPHGGFVPKGRWAEDGPIPPGYAVWELESPEPAMRTAANVRHADATLIVTHGAPRGGTALTAALARDSGKPWLHLDLGVLEAGAAARLLAEWLAANPVGTLNVAGPRASEDTRIHAAVHALLLRVLGPG